MSTIIKPAPGRVVWYWPNAYDTSAMHGADMSHFDPTQPLTALVAYVYNERLVNLVVFDQVGKRAGRTSVRLLQEGDTAMPGEAYAQWMPFQLGQARKHEPEAPKTDIEAAAAEAA